MDSHFWHRYCSYKTYVGTNSLHQTWSCDCEPQTADPDLLQEQTAYSLNLASPKPVKHTIVLQEPLCNWCNSTYQPLWTPITFVQYPSPSPVLVLVHLEFISTSKGSFSIGLRYQMRETCSHCRGVVSFRL